MTPGILRLAVAVGLLGWIPTGWSDSSQSAASQFKSFLNDIGSSAGQAVGQGVSNIVNGAGGAASAQPATPQPANTQAAAAGNSSGTGIAGSTSGTAPGSSQGRHRFTVAELISRAHAPSCIQFAPSEKNPTMDMRINNNCGNSLTMVLRHQPIGKWQGGCSTVVLPKDGISYNTQALDAEILGFCPGSVKSFGLPCGCPSGGAYL